MDQAMPMEVPEVRYGRQMTATSPSLLTPARMNGQYSWTLNIYPKVSEVCQYLRQELTKVSGEVVAARFEPATNVFLLCCAISDTADDSMLGTGYDFSRIGSAFPAGPAIRAFDKIVSYRRKWREFRSAALVKWRKRWQACVEAYIHDWLLSLGSDLDARVKELQSLLRDVPFSKDLLGTRIRVPAAFRSQDLTPFDVLSLGRAYAQQVRNSTAPILVVGLRTVGSYFAPILTAYLRSQGHRQVVSLTIRPRKGLGPAEEKALLHWAKKGAIAVVIDEPVKTGGTLHTTLEILRTAGFSRDMTTVLTPTRPTKADWSAGNDELGLASVHLMALEPKDWYRQQQLQPDQVEQRLQGCFLEQGYKSAILVNGDAVEQLNRSLQLSSERPFNSRLKQIYEFQLKDSAGRTRTVYVHAKSVGWGWLSYHALIAASRLPAFVPPVLGLDGGILYTEWLPQATDAPEHPDRYSLIGEISLYVAARARTLRLDESLAADLSREHRNKGFEILAGALSGIYGSKPAAFLKRARIYETLSQQPCPFPTFIDGNMRTSEWILSPGSQSLKTDFEHHGLGETELNVTDPAYDLADAILQFGMSRLEEARLIAGYRLSSGDNDVEERMMVYKILSGLRMMDQASDTLSYPVVPHKHETYNKQYVNARRLLTIHTARHCAKWMNKPPRVQWTSPLVALDIDGILDKQIIGFPSTTPAAIRALSLLHSHGVSTIVNTTRTAAEVKEYCDIFQLLGGIAEYGSIIYDAVSRRWRPLVSDESLAQMDAVRGALRRIPGVFVDDAYQYSLRAYAYERGTTVPIHTSTVQRVMVTLGADQLAYHQTDVDTAVVAREVDKGKSLTAYMDFIGKPDMSTIAVGDSPEDLPMFRAATRSFAPAHISCARTARTLGCTTVSKSYQKGFLEIAQKIVHPDGSKCDKCRTVKNPGDATDDLLLTFLTAADKSPRRPLFEALLDPMSIRNFAT